MSKKLKTYSLLLIEGSLVAAIMLAIAAVLVSAISYISVTQKQQEIVVYAIDFSQAVTDGEYDNLAEVIGMGDGYLMGSFKTQYNSAQIYYAKLVTNCRALVTVIILYLLFLLSRKVAGVLSKPLFIMKD